jgi:hypothetical protein
MHLYNFKVYALFSILIIHPLFITQNISKEIYKLILYFNILYKDGCTMTQVYLEIAYCKAYHHPLRIFFWCNPLFFSVTLSLGTPFFFLIKSNRMVLCVPHHLIAPSYQVAHVIKSQKRNMIYVIQNSVCRSTVFVIHVPYFM